MVYNRWYMKSTTASHKQLGFGIISLSAIGLIGALLLGLGGQVTPTEALATPTATNGRLVAYTRGIDSNGDGIFLGGSAEEAGTDIYDKDITTNDPPVMVNAPNNVLDITPSFSPDGTKITWSSAATPNGSLDIMVKDLKTGVVTNLTNTPKGTNERWPNWSNDGKQIVYNRKDGKNNLDIWIMNADGSNPHYVAGYQGAGKYAEDCCASFTPDDKAVIFASNRLGNFNIYRYNLSRVSSRENSTYLRQLTSLRPYEGTPSVEATGTVVYRYGGNQQMYRLNPYTARITSSLITTPGQIRTPQGTPDGMGLIFGWRESSLTQLDIMMSDANGNSMVNLTNTPDYSETDPVLQPIPNAKKS